MVCFLKCFIFLENYRERKVEKINDFVDGKVLSNIKGKYREIERYRIEFIL